MTKVLGPVNLMLQRNRRAKPLCVHVDKVKPYVADVLPQSWLVEQPVSQQGVSEISGSFDLAIPAPEDMVISSSVIGEAVIAGVPNDNTRTPWPGRHAGRPKRFLS